MNNTRSALKLTPKKLKIMLLIALVLQVALIIGVFSYGSNMLTSFARDVSNKHADAAASAEKLDRLQLVEQELVQYEDLPALLTSLRATGELPQFKAVTDLNAIATRYKIPISNVSFIEPDAEARGAGSISVEFTVDRAIPYRTFLNFLNAVENNTPKMSIKSVNLGSDSNKNSVTPGRLQLTLYTR